MIEDGRGGDALEWWQVKACFWYAGQSVKGRKVEREQKGGRGFMPLRKGQRGRAGGSRGFWHSLRGREKNKKSGQGRSPCTVVPRRPFDPRPASGLWCSLTAALAFQSRASQPVYTLPLH